jgi:hypothetical protein
MKYSDIKYSDGIIKKSDTNDETTYILCPDPECELFFDVTRNIPCESDCPHIEKQIKIIKCHCGELVELPGDHHMFRRVEHNCANGNTAWMFQRMSGKYRLIYERPRD